MALLALSGSVALGQIDPEKRQLIQFGYNQPWEGHGPLSGYAFYYRNEPGFLRTNITLRLAIAPGYLDSEIGFKDVLPERTDIGIGVAGGGFADSYFEVRHGRLINQDSFTGHSGEVSFNIYHLFNPNQTIPLNAILRISPHYSVYERDSKTAKNFVVPPDRTTFNVRSGLRWGGREPTTFPDLAMELSAWYEGQVRTDSGPYGYNGDRYVQQASHLFWARGLLIYTLPELKHQFGINFTLGTSLRVDRFSAYRLGGVLPLVSEFPLTLPGYYYDEISARRFALLSGQYSVPFGAKKSWSLTAIGTVAWVDYLPGFELRGDTHAGAGLGVGYKSPRGRWQTVVAYSYGFNAERSHGLGAQSIGVLLQWDIEATRRARTPYFDSDSPSKSRGLFRIFEP